ncbi:aminotransferase class I/II-fold pyridoxal phosphate-dependent enzyme [Microcella humidisoli]|uniref:aminotransferase class I/II-fold pyridoxal phosphate-dependent enzyme n=1 Tax=Microcella humidisoli TaxID=2963406 RepID=UPI0038993845
MRSHSFFGPRYADPVSIDAPWMRASRAAGLIGSDGTARPTIFAEMSALALEHDAVNLGQGFPDDDGPAPVLEAAVEAIRAGVNQYPPGRGVAELRQAIAEHQQRFYGLSVDPAREVLVTAGATEAIAASLLALAGPGDDVVTVEPYYDAYAAVIGLSGARHITIPLSEPGFQPSPDAIDAAITNRTAVIVLNSPHNPTGSILAPEHVERIVAAAARHDAVIVSDEVYEHLVFDGARHRPTASYAGAAERTLTVSSAAKTFNVTGWKIGWVTGPAELVDAVLGVKQWLTYVNGAPFQGAVARGLQLDDGFYDGLRATLQRRRDLLATGLVDAGFTIAPTAGSYFIVADGSPLGLTDAAASARALAVDPGVVAIPLSAFGLADAAGGASVVSASALRFAFCKPDHVIAEGVRRLQSLRR